MTASKSILIFSLIMILAISTTLMGCIDEQITDEQLEARISAAYNNIETYRVDMDLTVSITGEQDGMSIDTTIPITGSYLFDLPHNKAQIEMSMVIPAGAQTAGMPQTVSSSFYLIDNTLYVNGEQVLGPGSSVQWVKLDLNDFDYAQTMDSQNMIGQLSGLLSSMYEIAVTDKYKLNNIDAYEVTITPDMKQAFAMLMLIQGTGGINFGPMDAAQLEQFLSAIKELAVKQWFEKGSFEPIRTSLHMTLADSESDFSMDTDVVMNFENINSDLVITLPASAHTAVDMMELLSSMGIEGN